MYWNISLLDILNNIKIIIFSFPAELPLTNKLDKELQRPEKTKEMLAGRWE